MPSPRVKPTRGDSRDEFLRPVWTLPRDTDARSRHTAVVIDRILKDEKEAASAAWQYVRGRN
jgi:hypothetical protein